MGTETLETDERFTEEQLAQDRATAAGGVKNPSLAELKKSLAKYGPEGVLESARHLDPDAYDELARQVRATAPIKTVRHRRRH